MLLCIGYVFLKVYKDIEQPGKDDTKLPSLKCVLCMRKLAKNP